MNIKRFGLLPGTMALAVLSGCGTSVIGPNLADNFWEQDVNTHPRFVHLGRSRNASIGTLLTDGSQVFVNGRQVNDPFAFPNNGLLVTGANSGARLEFDNAGQCLIDIFDFQYGRGYGQSSGCRHRVLTVQSESSTRTFSSAYHIETTSQRAVITVYQGTLEVATRAQSGQRVIAQTGHEVIATGGTLIGPRPVPAAELERRISWRGKFNFNRSNMADFGAILGVIGAGILIHELTDDDDDNDVLDPRAEPRPPSNPRDDVNLTPRLRRPILRQAPSNGSAPLF